MVKLPAQPAALMGWMESLSDPIRLRLLRLLEKQELGVTELCDVLQLPQSTVSRHLKVLGDQHWVLSRRQGTTHLYRTLLDELDPSARRLWLLAREQTADWATTQQDELRLIRRLQQRQEQDAQTFFAGAAVEWDKMRAELYGSAFGRAALFALIPATHVVADLGCGTGQAMADLAPHVRQVVGVDNSAAMLKAARKRTAEFENVVLRRGDLEALPLESESVDAAILMLALTYTPEPVAAVREAARVVKPGGRLVLVDLLPHDRDDFRREMGQRRLGFSTEEIRTILMDGGFIGVVAQSLPPEPSAKGPALFLATATRVAANDLTING